MAEWFLTVKRAFPGDFLYLDVGANIGIHGLHAAKAGATVWAVEPQAKNLQKVRISYYYFQLLRVHILFVHSFNHITPEAVP